MTRVQPVAPCALCLHFICNSTLAALARHRVVQGAGLAYVSQDFLELLVALVLVWCSACATDTVAAVVYGDPGVKLINEPTGSHVGVLHPFLCVFAVAADTAEADTH